MTSSNSYGTADNTGNPMPNGACVTTTTSSSATNGNHHHQQESSQNRQQVMSLQQQESGVSVSSAATNEYVLNFAFWTFIGFVCVQAVFSILAHSQAMLADSEAMAVDALTYLFNLCAERIKNRPYSEHELCMAPALRDHKREMQRLYLELIPPTVSVATLIGVTVTTLQEAFGTLKGIDANGGDDDVSITIMLIFSAANLLLDIVNVTCFARANVAFGLDVMQKEGYSIGESIRESWRHISGEQTLSSSLGHGGTMTAPATIDEDHSLVFSDHNNDNNETTNLLLQNKSMDDDGGGEQEFQKAKSPNGLGRISSSRFTPEGPHEIINLNMCSAWTHVCADTLRSCAVLIAAGFAFLIPSIEPDVADSVAAIIVSFIILGSLLPLLQGLCLTSLELFSLLRGERNASTAKSVSDEISLSV